jgi:UDP-GlcNAc:undecaprenyl-phosphate GlcNAc-1-phosphate transferase
MRYSFSTLVAPVGTYWPVLLISFLATLVLTPLCRKLALSRRLVDRPDDFLKPHKNPIPYLGGVAIFAGWGAGLILAVARLGVPVERTLGVVVAGFGIMLLGLFDDLRVMSPKPKLIGNVIVAVWLIWIGVGARVADSFGGLGLTFGPGERWLEILYSWPLAIFIIVGACNATNVIDGLDGLCSGVLGIIAFGFLMLSCHLTLFYATDADNPLRVTLSLAMLGAALGFLPYNTNPAKIFMGDAGSMLLGLNAAVLILLVFETNKLRWVIGGLMIFGLPIGDMLLALVRRWRNGRPVMGGDRSHFYDQLVDRGLSVKQVVAVSYLLTLLFVGAGCLVIFLRARQAVPAYVLFVLFWVIVVSKLGMVSLESDRRRPNSKADGCGAGDVDTETTPGLPYHEEVGD